MARNFKPVHMERYLNRINQMPILMKQDKYIIPMPTDEESAKRVIERMECDISPENLTCDGELPRREVESRYNEIMRAKGDLELILGRKIELEY